MKKDFEITKQLSTPYKASSVFTLSMVAVMGVYVIMSVIVSLIKDKVDLDKSLIYFSANYFVISLALLIGFFITYRKNKLVLYDVTNLKFSKKFLAVIPLIALGALFGLSNLNDYFVSLLELFGYVANTVTLPGKSAAAVIMTIIFVAVIPAFSEELVFRGLMLKGAEYFGKLQAVLVTAAAFSLYHMSPAQTVYQFIIGVIYGLVAIKSGSVIPTMILHFLNNFIIITIYYFFPNFSVEGVGKIIITICGVLALLAGLFLMPKGEKLNDKKDYKKQELVDYLGYLIPGFLICIVMWVANLFA